MSCTLSGTNHYVMYGSLRSAKQKQKTAKQKKYTVSAYCFFFLLKVIIGLFKFGLDSRAASQLRLFFEYQKIWDYRGFIWISELKLIKNSDWFEYLNFRTVNRKWPKYIYTRRVTCIRGWLFSQNEHYLFCGQSELILGILCMHLLLQFYADSFDTLQMFRSWSEGVHFICM